jgi:hypothetical protein
MAWHLSLIKEYSAKPIMYIALNQTAHLWSQGCLMKSSLHFFLTVLGLFPQVGWVGSSSSRFALSQQIHRVPTCAKNEEEGRGWGGYGI